MARCSASTLDQLAQAGHAFELATQALPAFADRAGLHAELRGDVVMGESFQPTQEQELPGHPGRGSRRVASSSWTPSFLEAKAHRRRFIRHRFQVEASASVPPRRLPTAPAHGIQPHVAGDPEDPVSEGPLLGMELVRDPIARSQTS